MSDMISEARRKRQIKIQKIKEQASVLEALDISDCEISAEDARSFVQDMNEYKKRIKIRKVRGSDNP